MKLSYVFTYQAVVAILFGLSGLVVPTTLGDMYGASFDKLAQTLAQYFGAAFITIGLISWFLRTRPNHQSASGSCVRWPSAPCWGLSQTSWPLRTTW